MKKFYSIALAALVTMSAAALTPQATKNPTKQPKINRIEGIKAANARELSRKSVQQPLGLSARKAAKKRVEGTEAILAPEGEAKNYTAQTTAFVYTMFGLSYSQQTVPGQIVWGENGEVYIRDIISMATSGAYVKGTYADGKVTVKLPQVCYVEIDEEYPDEIFEAYATVMNYYEYQLEEDGDIYMGYENAEEEECEIVYTVNEDGTLTLTLNDGDPTVTNVAPEKIIGLCDDPTPGLDSWFGYGDAYQTYSEFSDTPVTAPESVEFEPWVIISNSENATCQVGFDGNDVYVKGFWEYDPETTFKGTIEGDKVIFPRDQYLGEVYGYFVYLEGVLWADDTWSEFDLIDLEMSYDAEAKVMATDNDLIDMVFNANKDEYDALYYFENPTIRYQSEEEVNAAPQDPYVTYFEDLAMQDYLGYEEGYIEWEIPAVNVNGALLDTGRMSYVFFKNGEIMTFTTEEYPEFEIDITEFPYEYSDDWDLQVSGASHYFSFRWDDYKNFGLQSYYEGSDNVRYASNVVVYDTTGVKTINANGKLVRSADFYDLQGRKVVNPTTGIYVVRYTFEDGTSAVAKIVK